jgi:hypothetical protein
MKISALRFILCAVVAMVLSLNVSAQTQAGQIKAARVEGEVSKVTKDGSSIKIKNGDALTESDIVTTGKGSSVVLIFMNGSTVKLGADSRLAIDEFKMDPLAASVKVSDLKAEPTVSKTSLNLAYGELVGDVKHLNTSAGSYYNIKTPVGAAGIRGTQFRIVFRPTSDGKAFTFTLSTAEGLVLFTGTTQGSGAPVDVPLNQEVVVTGNVDPATGQITLLTPIATQPISAEAKQQIAVAVEQVVQQAQQTNFTPPTPPPNDVPPPIQLTPGAG